MLEAVELCDAFIAGFFEAIKQNHSRNGRVPVEDIAIKFDDTAHVDEKLVKM